MEAFSGVQIGTLSELAHLYSACQKTPLPPPAYTEMGLDIGPVCM